MMLAVRLSTGQSVVIASGNNAKSVDLFCFCIILITQTTNRHHMEHIEKRGGPNRNQGRKPLSVDEETLTMCLRMTRSQREKLDRLGGAKWVRSRIDREKE